MGTESAGASELSAAAAGEGFDETAARALAGSLPPGTWPMRPGRSVLLVSVVPGVREPFVWRPGAEALEDYLRDSLAGARGFLADRDGNVLAVLPWSDERTGAGRADEIVSSSSLAAFWAAFSECLSGAGVPPFSIELAGPAGARSMTATLSALPGGLVWVGLARPSLDLAGFCPVEVDSVESIIASLPIPAIVIGPDDLVRRTNEAAQRLVPPETREMLLGSRVWDWINPADLESTRAIHRSRLGGSHAPTRYQVHTMDPSGTDLLVEVTAHLLPDGSSTLVMFVPVESLSGMTGPSGAADGLASLVETFQDSTDPAGLALEVILQGTGARGAVLKTDSGVRTTGSTPVDPSGADDDTPVRSGETATWEPTPDSFFDMRSTVRLHNGMSRLKLLGLRTNRLAGLSRLALATGRMLLDYGEFAASHRELVRTLSSVLETWENLRTGETGPSRFLARAADLVSADAMVVWGSPGGEGALHPVLVHGLNRNPEPLSISSETSPGWVYAHSEMAYVADTAADERFSPLSTEFRSEVVIPLLRRHGRAAGALQALSRAPGSFQNPAPHLLQVLSMPLSQWLIPEKGPEQAGPVETGQARSDLEDVLISLGHRLRAPGAAVRGTCEILLSGSAGPLNPEQTEMLLSIDRSAVRLSAQVDRLLSLLRLEMQGGRMEGSWARPTEVVESMLPGLAARAREAGVAVASELPAAPFTAYFDRQRLEEVIWNLVDNAVRFTPKGGSVDIRMRTDGRTWTLEVEDSGRGIPSRILPFVFDRFYRGPGEEAGGLGIGLSIVRSFCEQMSGTVNVFSREGRGSRFTVRLPVAGRQE
jgi:signal transduction histidine kinase/PAS domain-containing protein